MKKTTTFVFISFFLCLTVGIKPLRADDLIIVGHGDQFVLTLRNNELVDIDHTILLTSNKTIEGTYNEIQSIDGRLEGEPTYVMDSDIDSCEVLWKVEDGLTKFNITIKATVEPLKFKSVTISYTLNGSLNYKNGSWHFRKVFSSTAGALAPPEIVVKVPKPSEFDDLSFEEIIPIPHVFLEEGPHYILVWKSEVFLVGNTSATLVRLKYSATKNWHRILVRFAPPIITFVAGLIVPSALKRARATWKRFKEKRKKPSKTKTAAKTSKKKKIEEKRKS